MIKFSVLYPYSEGCWFDAKYYVEKHIAPYREDPLVKGILVESGSSARNFVDPPRYACIAHFFYDSLEDLEASRNPQRVASQIQDNVNFTNIQGTNLVSTLPYCRLDGLKLCGQAGGHP